MIFSKHTPDVVEHDISDLGLKIQKAQNQTEENPEFQAFRLARGIYGQRQDGVQMIRIKIPYGKIFPHQLVKIAKATEKYSHGILHFTTRQNIQIYYVKIEDVPNLWKHIDDGNITLREACGNTIRNITSSPISGVDEHEPFDVMPHVQAVFEYFLRNPLNQDLGRKMKFAFSSGLKSKDSSIFIHDLGFIPIIQNDQKGFQVFIGGGLGAQPQNALLLENFVPENEIIPLIEATVRVFALLGERKKRMKARLKFLVKSEGIESLKKRIDEERKILEHPSVEIPPVDKPAVNTSIDQTAYDISEEKYKVWLKTNTISQKQEGFVGVFVNPTLGNITSKQAIQLAELIPKYASEDMRITQNQGLFLRFVRPENLRALYYHLNKIGLGKDGFDSTADVTSCPGTDTCNLGISNSTFTATQIEKFIREKYNQLIQNFDLKIKLSGCPNSCGQHGLASIGFHGSSQKVDGKLMPYLQVCLGGATLENGYGISAEKVIKIPSKRVLKVVDSLLNDYWENKKQTELYHEYFARQGKIYFYDLLLPYASKETIQDDEFLDWGSAQAFELKKAVGECAGVVVDLHDVLMEDSEEKLALSQKSLKENRWSDSLYHAYNALIAASKAFLLDHEITPSNQLGIIQEAGSILSSKKVEIEKNFQSFVLSFKETAVKKSFVQHYVSQAETYIFWFKNTRS